MPETTSARQSGWFFQAKAARTTLEGNVMFNAPRNGITFNDPFGGGDRVAGNLAFSAMRETGDGGTYNSWDRQPFLTTALDGEPSPFMAWREIAYNFMINNYHEEMNIDTDDGSSWVKAHHNFLVGGEWGMKSDEGGHSNWQWSNLNAYAYGPAIFLMTGQSPGLEDRYFNNTIIQLHGPVAGFGTSTQPDAQLCAGINVTGTRMFNLLGAASKCPNGPSLMEAGAGNSVSTLPADDDVIQWAKELLGM